MPPHFIGRESVVAKLVARITSGEERALALVGPPGVGKTTLVVALAYHRQLLAYFINGVLWASLGPQGEAYSALAKWAQALGEDISHLKELEERQERVQQLIGQLSLLLVIDDVWDIKKARALQCGGPNCYYLLTSREFDIAQSFAGKERTISVTTLDDEVSYQLLKTLAPEACEVEPFAVQRLINAIGGLPLALNLVGSYLAYPDRLVFPELISETWKEITDPARRLELASERLGHRWLGDVTLKQTILLSLETLPEDARNAFYALGAFAPKPEQFSLKAAKAVAQVDERTLALLIIRNLLEKGNTEESLALHQILADLARTGVPLEAKARHRDYYLERVKQETRSWRQLELVYGQVKWAWASMPEDEGMLTWIKTLTEYQIRRGLLWDLIDWSEKGVQFAKNKGLLSEQVNLYITLGTGYLTLGQLHKSLEQFENALYIIREVRDQAGEARILNVFGNLYKEFDQREKAHELHDQALAIYLKLGDRVGEAMTLLNIGEVFQGSSQPQKALEKYEQALRIMRKVGIQMGEASALEKIGEVYLAIGQPQKALENLEQALPIVREMGDLTAEIIMLNNLGNAYRDSRELQKALEKYKQVLKVIREMGNRTLDDTTLEKKGGSYPDTEPPQKVPKHSKQNLTLISQISNRNLEVITLMSIGAIYQEFGQPQKALENLEQALHIVREMGDRVLKATTLEKIGEVYLAIGQPQKALENLEQALPIVREMGNRTLEATTLDNLGSAYRNMMQMQKALELTEQALYITREVNDRVGEGAVLYNIGLIYYQTGQIQKAFENLEQALPIVLEVGDSFSESLVRYALAMIYESQGHLEDSVLELQRVIELDRLFGDPNLNNHLNLLHSIMYKIMKRR
jgi:tetratricopeptide (TPR) repeat protein